MIALDLSRLLSRAGIATPTGIDRVELAYARQVLADGRAHSFAAVNAAGAFGALPEDGTARFVAELAAIWHDGAAPGQLHGIGTLARQLRRAALFGGAMALRAQLRHADNPVYLLVSHHHLDRSRGIARLKARSRARFVCLIHDLIPLDHPHHTRPRQTVRHRRRIDTVAALADAAIVNSAATQSAMLRHLAPEARQIPLAVAPLGIDIPASGRDGAMPGDPPYFVCVGTIEARKNHALLLDVWQRLAAEAGGRAPRLVLVGRRGWDSAKISARLPALRGAVSEHPDASDAAMTALLRGARALLLPSFAEGYGLPVVEALALGVPVVCSDLTALRESAGMVPDYLDPRDAASWRAAIGDYAIDSPRRRAQLARLEHWRAPRWEEHFAIVDRLLAELR